MIFDIQRFSTHDGPGVRTVVFFKGCPLACRWCENPESQSRRPELLYDERLCIGCLDCTRVAPAEVSVEGGRPHFHRERISDPTRYREVCPSGALTVKGEELTVERIVAEVEKDRLFFGSDGGVTLSGGEPFAQAPLLFELVRALRGRSIDVAIETSLAARWRAIERILPFVSLILADLKSCDGERFHQDTGGRLPLVLDNFERLAVSGTPTIIRVPVIPGFNDSDSAIEAIVRRATLLSNVREIHFLPYHTLGKGKYTLLGRSYPYPDAAAPADSTIARFVALATSAGLTATVGG